MPPIVPPDPKEESLRQRLRGERNPAGDRETGPVSEGREVIKQRLSSLTPAQRALLARRFNGERTHAETTGGAHVSMPKEPPLRVDVDGDGSQVAVHPASNGQQRIWFMHHFMRDCPAYCTPMAYHLRGSVPVLRLEEAFHQVIQRHESFRTTFAMEKRGLVQRIASSSTFRIEHAPVLRAPAEDRMSAAKHCIEKAACLPFDLAAAPPFRVVLASIRHDEHLLLVVMHHIITDGWSFSNLCRELSTIYAALTAGVPVTLPELPVQFAGYSAWQRRRLESGAFEEQAAYWKRKLSGDPEPLNIPADRLRPATESFRGGDCSLEIDRELVTALKARAQERNATLFMVLLAAFKVLLHRYTCQTDVLVGVPIANRQRPEAEGLIGLFANTLVMRTEVSGDAAFEEILDRVRQTALEAYEHQDMPFEVLVRLLQVRRDAGMTPLFQATFALQDFPEADLQLAGLEVAPFPVSTQTSKFDLSLAVRPTSRGLRAAMEFSLDLFEPERARQMLDHWRAVLLDVAANPARRVSEISLLSPAEKHRLLVEWNDTARDYPRDKCVHEVFEEQVERAPDAAAVVFEGQSLSYRELNSRANRLAHHLRALGVGPGVLVGLCVERSFEMIAGLLGILKAGGAYVPLDPANPPERLALILEDAHPPVLLTQRKLAARLPDLKSKIIYLDDSQPAEWDCQPATNPGNQASPEDLAYVIFTSGSTGQPKGVLITHHNVVRLMQATADWFQFDERDVWTMFHSYAFDVSVWEIWGALFYGGRLVIVPYSVSRSPSAFYELLLAQKVTVLSQTPSAFLPFIQAEASAGVPGELALRYVIFGGEALSMQSLEPWFERHGDARPQLVNMYGITETTVHVTYRPLTKNDVKGPSLIGRPIPDLQIYILDSLRQPVPIGITGELFIGGAGLARGYLNRPDLTKERFIPNPFSSDPDARLYRTGDLARWRPDGDIEYLGRADRQIKIRGHRIEAGEIEAVLNGHPEVASCAVLAQDVGGEDKSLAAFVVGREKAEPSIRSLRQWLAQKLPDYMIPSRFMAVPAMPLNINGKVDQKALLKLDGVELVSGADYVAPRDQRERELVEIWQTVLRRERVGVRDNFFDLGGHSLLAVSMCLRITSLLRVEVPLRWLFEYPTIEGLAKKLKSSAGELQTAKALEKTDRKKPMPMSFAQQQMWLVQQTLPDQATYNQAVGWHFSGRVDREKVRRSLQAILERHEVLRTALVQNGEDLLQQIVPAKDVALPWKEIDLRAVPPGQRKAALEGLMLEEARLTFDLDQAPVWRAIWVELDEDEHALAVTFHHSIVDEWSLRLFFQELEAIYNSDGQVKSANLPELPIQYTDYSAWQRRQLTGPLREQLLDYWKKQLWDLPPALELPADLTRPPQPSGRGAFHDFQLTDTVAGGFRALASRERTTLFTVMLAAFQVWLHRCTGQNDLIVCTPMANRERPEVKALLGYFLNPLAIRVRLDGSRSFTEAVRQVRETALEAFGHAKLPFEQIVEMTIKDRPAAQHALYQVMFVLLEEGIAPLRLDQARSRLLPVETMTSKNDLFLSVQALDQSLACRLHYATDLFSADRAGSMARHLTELFRSIAENPQKPIGQLNLLPEAERRQILVEWNDTARDYPRDKCVHEVFEEQAERAPGAVAVVFEGQSLSYGELNSRANRLAHHLRALGVGPDVLVGLCVERSFEMIIGLLGILKAGGAYWALEENLPQERLRVILADARPKVLLFRRQSGKPPPDLPGDSAADRPALVSIEELLESSPVETAAATPPNQAGAPAYVSYTSGSTGQPKGVVVPHRGVVRLVKGADYVSLNPEETLLHLSPLSFDASTFELWGALLNGGRVVVMPPGPFTLGEIGEAIRLHGVTTAWLTAGLFHLMVDECLDDLKPLRQLLAGGDVLSPEHVRKARRSLPGCRIINGYGPTENTTFTCCHAVEDERDLAPGVPIGRPISNTQVYILDEARQPVPVGVAGELYAGGDGVACGYLHQPELTAERFVPDPFSPRAGARLYRTGDRARWRSDGNIEFLGRLDSQAKIRGFRVELGEIEAALRAQPEVRDAIAIVRASAPGDQRLVAFLVAKAGKKPDAAILRARLAKKLPQYMLPNSFVWLEQLPMTPSGKVDRKALPAPETCGWGAPGENDRPIDLLELELTRIWQRLFQRDDIGRQDNFFALGGHSLLATRLAAEIDKLLGCKLPIAALFQSPTMESLARRLHDEDWAPPWSSLVPLQPRGSRPPLFFVHGSAGDVYGVLDLAGRIGPDQPSYGIQAVGLDGRSPRHVTVEEMAAHYVREIVSFQKEGPYYLAGYSLGGVFAFEVAQQLHRLGRRVALLALMDSGPIQAVPWFFHGLAMATYLPVRCLVHLRQWWKLPLREQLDYVRGRWAALRYWMLEKNRSKPTLVTAPPPPGAELPEFPGSIDYYHAVAFPYHLRSYPGSVDVFVSDEASLWLRWHWKYLARGGAAFHRVPGGHLEILSGDNLPVLARSLTAVLQRKQANERAALSPGGPVQDR